MKKRLLLAVILTIGTTGMMVSCSSSDDSKTSETTDTGERFQSKVLVEDATGTWCQYCPRVAYSIQKAKENTSYGDQVVAVAIHQGVNGYADPMQITASNKLVNLFSESYNLKGFPFGLINRTAVWKYPENNNLAQVFNSINKDGSPVGIKIASELNNTGGTISVSFKFAKGYQDLSYSIFVIENGVVTTNSPQQNSTGFFNGETTNFVHNDVLRGTVGEAIGNSLGNAKAGQEITKSGESISYTLFNNNLQNVEVVAFVTDSDGKVLNVQSAHANQTVDYVSQK